MERGAKSTRPDRQCRQAASVIMEMLRFHCQGFVLPPPDARHLLGLDPSDRMWHLHARTDMLRRELARRFVAVEVNPIQGITVQLYRAPLPLSTALSPRFMRQ